MKVEVEVPKDPNELIAAQRKLVDTSHLWMMNGRLIIRGMVVSSGEIVNLPFRNKKDHELASQNAIAREIERVEATYVPGTNQPPHEFEGCTKLYLREDIG